MDLSLKDLISQASADFEARKVQEAEVPKTELIVEERVPAPRPKDLSLEMNVDEVVILISNKLTGTLPESLMGALEALPAEFKKALDKAFEAITGLKEGVEKRYEGLRVKREEYEARRKTGEKRDDYKEFLAGFFGKRLPHGICRELLTFDGGAFAELSAEQYAEIDAKNKAVDEHRKSKKEGHPNNCPKCKKTVYQESQDHDGAIHYYMPRAEWLKHTLWVRNKTKTNAHTAWNQTVNSLSAIRGDGVKDALFGIAMGEKLTVVGYLPREAGIKIDGRPVFGPYIVQGVDPVEGVTPPVPQMIFTTFEAAASPMYPAVSPLFGGVLQFKTLRDKNRPEYAFADMQEKSGQAPHNAKFARKILMATLGIKEKRRDERSGSTYSSGKPSQTTTKAAFAKAQGVVGITQPVLPEVPIVKPEEAPKTPSRRVRREEDKKRKEGEVGRPETRERGGANSRRHEQVTE